MRHLFARSEAGDSEAEVCDEVLGEGQATGMPAFAPWALLADRELVVEVPMILGADQGILRSAGRAQGCIFR